MKLTQPLVCVVDDDADTRQLYRIILETVGYRVEEAGHLAAAADLFERTAPDVVLTDWLLPDGTGLQACDALQSRRQTRTTPIVVLTGLSRDDVLRAASASPAQLAVLEKPADPNAVLLAIKSALDVAAEGRVRRAALRVQRYARRRETRCRGARWQDPADLIARVAARATGDVSLLIADDRARYVAVGGHTRDLIGYEPGELTGRSVWDLTPPPEHVQSHLLWEQFISSGVQQGRYTMHRRDGRTVEAFYCAIANIAPGMHVSALAEAVQNAAVLV